MSTLEEIKEKSGVKFRPASAAGVNALRSLGVAEDALAFYRDSEPLRFAEIAKVRLRFITDILAENRDYVPGAYVQPCGYVVFAITLYGDAFCFDLRASSIKTAPVVLIAHDLEPENDEMKREDLAKLAKPIAGSFEDFLRAFISGTLDIEPLDPPFDPGSAHL